MFSTISTFGSVINSNNRINPISQTTVLDGGLLYNVITINTTANITINDTSKTYYYLLVGGGGPGGIDYGGGRCGWLFRWKF